MSRSFLRRLVTHWPLLLALGLGLLLRIALWERLPREGLVSDEAEYLAAADWLANGRGFAWHTSYLWTRAPLYPLFLASHLALFGRSLAPIFVSQGLLSMLNIGLTYLLTRRLSTGRVRLAAAPGIAALLVALYLPLASYTQLLLSETLFVSLLLGSLLLLGNVRVAGQAGPSGRRMLWLAGAGLLLGLATLTRGLALGFVPMSALWLLLRVRQDRRHNRQPWLGPALGQVSLLLAAVVMVVAPWSLYATRTYGGPILIDTTGAFNLALGARTAYDGGRSDEPTRNFVLALLLPELSLEQREALLAERRRADGTLERAAACLYAQDDPQLRAALVNAPALSQADRQRLLNAEAVCLLRARPLAFVAKSLVELIDLFMINYSGDERLSGGFSLGRLPPWYALALFLLDDLLYVLALPLALLGWARLRSSHDRPSSASQALLLLVGLWLLYNLAVAPLLFAINRFRVPLMPFALALAAAALADLPGLLPFLRSRYGLACAGLAALLLLVAASPHAYLEPRATSADARWASLLGPYPSSLAATRLALQSRAGYLREAELAAALGAGEVAAARVALAAPDLPAYAAAVGAPLLDSLEGRPAAGLDRLASQPERPLEAWQTSVVAGELFRQLGDLEAARREFGPTLVDSQNPVAWTWAWFYPPRLPTDRLVLAQDNDLGYIQGFYLGRYDAAMPRFDGGQGATVRWATGKAALRFPGAASGSPQQLCLEVSGRGWPEDLALPQVHASLAGEPLGSFGLTRSLEQVCLELPTRPAETDLVVQLDAPSFVPAALDLIAQQGPQVGQLRLLAYQLAAAEVR